VFKVNTEAVLLSAWVNVNDYSEVLEIGSGTGVIALGLKQRLDEKSSITTIDIDRNAFELTQVNIELNQLENISAQHISLQDFCHQERKKRFDLIVSNPPYFDTPIKSFKPRNVYAKYTDSLSYSSLIGLSAKLMKTTGRIALVIPYLDIPQMVEILDSNKLRITRQLNVRTIPKKTPLRVLLEISHQAINSELREESELIIKDGRGQFTDDYRHMTKDFYTIF